MATIRPFRALRPTPATASAIVAPPYDVVNLTEARRLAEGNPSSFLRVSRAELELPDGTSPYTDVVYQRGANNLARLVAEQALVREPGPVLGLYQQQAGGHRQTGLVALASIAEYDQGIVKRHELTRPDKEDDRVRLIETHRSQSGPVFLAYRNEPRLALLQARLMEDGPEIEVTAADGVIHRVWVVREADQVAALVEAFRTVPHLYIADGHHRSAAASRVRAAHPEGPLGQDGFLSVIFPHDQLAILPYNRLVRDLGGLSADALREGMSRAYSLALVDGPPGVPPPLGFDAYVGGRWWRATPRPEVIPEDDPIGALAVSLLTNHILSPLLGIQDQRRDARIDFVGGVRPPAELQARVDSGEFALAMWLSPTGMEELMAVADADQIMPPKSTWFEPKLRDGFFIHLFDE